MTTSTSQRQEFRVQGLPDPVSHYTDAVRWGDQLYISGCVAMGTDGQVIAPGDVAAQARVLHEYIGAALHAAGTDFQYVLKVVVYLRNINDRQAVNNVRKQFFGDARPASTLVEVNALVLPELLVEMDVVAGIP